jgi:hypothetical protein
MLFATLAFLSCFAPPAVECDCGPAECAAICDKDEQDTPPLPKDTLSDYERSVVDPVLEDLRHGVRPWGEKTVGICPSGGARKCEDFLGTQAEGLPPGDYILHAELRVPKVGEGWRVRFETDCTTIKEKDGSETRTTKDYSKEYEVHYINEERGATLSPLTRIKSPGRYGRQECTWQIVAPHPDGDKTIKGSWSVPDGT